MILDRSKVRKAYERYGFFEQPCNEKNVMVFSIRTGHYHNADIIPLAPSIDVKQTFSEYQELGYACQIKEYNCVNEIESALFSGFFNLDSTRKRLAKDYDDFNDSLVKIHSDNATYTYIKTQYYVNNRALEGNSVLFEISDNSAWHHSAALKADAYRNGFKRPKTNTWLGVL